MKIIDKRKDYYDNVLPYSPEPVWVRKELSFTLESSYKYREKKPVSDNPFRLSHDILERLSEKFNSIPSPYSYFSSGPPNPTALVGFCGQFYVVLYKTT